MSAHTFLPPPFTRRLGLLALGLATLLPMLAGSMANMVLPALGAAFTAPFASLQWVLLAYLLGISCLSVVAGRLGDRFGHRRLLCWGMALFALASLLCALAPAPGWLIASRALQGAGAACMLSLALALVGRLVSPARRGRGMGLLGTLSACGTALGPSLGGLLIELADWRAPFLLLLALSLLGLVAGLIGLPTDGPRGETVRISPVGLLALAGCLLCYGVLLGGGAGHPLWPLPVGLFTAWLLWRGERRGSASLLPWPLLREPGVRGGLLGSALVASLMVLTLLIGPFYLQGVFGLGLAEVGLWISGGPLLAACTGLPAGWLVDRLGTRAVTRLGLGVMLLAVFGLVSLPVDLGPLGYLLPMLLLTAGYALFQTANNSAVVGGVDERSRGALAGLLTLSRNLGQLTGAAVLGSLFAMLVGGGNLGGAGAAALRSGMQLSFALAGLLIGLGLWVAGAQTRRALALG